MHSKILCYSSKRRGGEAEKRNKPGLDRSAEDRDSKCCEGRRSCASISPKTRGVAPLSAMGGGMGGKNKVARSRHVTPDVFFINLPVICVASLLLPRLPCCACGVEAQFVRAARKTGIERLRRVVFPAADGANFEGAAFVDDVRGAAGAGQKRTFLRHCRSQ